jgi:uncharacterized protein with PQ loop repeat
MLNNTNIIEPNLRPFLISIIISVLGSLIIYSAGLLIIKHETWAIIILCLITLILWLLFGISKKILKKNPAGDYYFVILLVLNWISFCAASFVSNWFLVAVGLMLPLIYVVLVGTIIENKKNQRLTNFTFWCWTILACILLAMGIIILNVKMAHV